MRDFSPLDGLNWVIATCDRGLRSVFGPGCDRKEGGYRIPPGNRDRTGVGCDRKEGGYRIPPGNRDRTGVDPSNWPYSTSLGPSPCTQR